MKDVHNHKRYFGRSALGAVGGFTLIEILMAMFIMALGVVGVMSLFPVGLGAVTSAMDSTMSTIIGQNAFAQMQCYMNTSETFDCGMGHPLSGGSVWRRFRPPSRSMVLQWVSDGRDQFRYWRLYGNYVEQQHNLSGYYVRFVKGPGAGQVRRIAAASGNTVTIDTTYEGRLGRLPEGLKVNVSKLIITRYGFPMKWKPPRLAKVASVSGSRVNAASINGTDRDPRTEELGWSGGEWDGGKYFILFTSGKGRGRLLRVSGGVSLNVNTGGVDLVNEDGVAKGDTFVILGCADLKPCTFPPNIGESDDSQFNNRFQTPPVVPYYTSPRTYASKIENGGQGEPEPAEYSYLCIISTGDTPRPPTGSEDTGTARTARIDVIVFRGYEMDKDGKWPPLEQQPRAIGFFTGYIPPL